LTSWGYFLLAAFVALGLTDRLSWRNAGKAAVILTAVVVVAAFANMGALR
jgi:hypothetical protein